MKKEKIEQMIIKKCAKCHVEFKTKHKTKAYCRKCWNEYQRNYGQRGFFLYIFVNENNKIMYIGVTTRLTKRMNEHTSGNSHIRKLILSKKWTCVKYVDLTNIIRDVNELHYLENALIQLYPSSFNSYNNNVKPIDKLREFELLSTIHSFEMKWKVYKTNPLIKEK